MKRQEAIKAERAKQDEAERKKVADAFAEKQRADYEEAKQASGEPNFKVEVFANTFQSHSHIIVPEHREVWAGGVVVMPPQFEESTSGHLASVQLTNLGSAIIVQKVTINDRPECSLAGAVPELAPLLQKDTVVKTGDVLSVLPLCAATVKVTVQTNRGTVTYNVQ